MKKPQIHLTEGATLRRKAEEQLKKRQSTVSSQSSEADIWKLTHELQVHQIELELQNEELLLAKERADSVAEKYIELYDFAPSGYFTLSKEGRILQLNLIGTSMLGLERQHLINQRLTFFIYNDTKTVFNEFLNKVFKEKTEESCEVTLSIEGRPPLYVYIKGHVADNDEKCQLTMVDITQIKSTEFALMEQDIKLRQLNADKDRFVSILSHDLRSPFSNILGLTEILKEDISSLDIDEIKNIANDINDTAQRTYNLLEDILTWARAQQGKIPVERQQLCFADICNNILETLNPIAHSKNITINCTPSDQLNVFSDVDMLKTILRNLVSNAIKFTDNGGVININAEQNSENVTISVSDNGVGIEPNDIKKLFDISEVLTTKGTAGETGTGLGLLLCKEFVEKHRGKIWVESEYGKGSEFKFTLPISVEQNNDEII
jgi:signal transduction histidine kinase